MASVSTHLEEEGAGDHDENDVGEPRTPKGMQDQGCHQEITPDVENVKGNDDEDTDGKPTDPS